MSKACDGCHIDNGGNVVYGVGKSTDERGTDMGDFRGKWDYEPDCMCAKCENFWNMLADCVGDARAFEGGASPDRPVKGWRLSHRVGA